MKKFIEEFKEFAIKGNVMDMAVGIVIGAAFGKIVTSFVDDIIMPMIGTLLGGVDFTRLSVTLRGGNELAYGNFIQTTLDFLIVALAIFLVIKGINKLRRKEEEKKKKEPQPSKEEKLLVEIRDLLKRKNQ